ncbi:MAG: DUF1552 domain-containing protein [Akkermansiaceae bacterium]|jgi:hypothetical protein
MNRRKFLTSSTASIALPALESFGAAMVAAPPVRLLYLGFLWGVSRNEWFPSQDGTNFQLPKSLEPLEAHRKDLTIIRNISPVHHSHHPHDTVGKLLTCMDHRQPKGAPQDLISVDQVAAAHLGKDTRYSSLAITSRNGGGGSGLSLSWDQFGKPLPGYADPVEIYNELFGQGKMSLAEREWRLNQDQSVLDSLHRQAKALEKQVSSTDRDKLDEYFTSIRQLEGKLKKSEEWLNRPKPKAPLTPPGAHLTGSARIKATYDLIAAALQTDLTRVISYRQPLNGLLKELGLPNAHPVNHQSDDALKEACIEKDRAQSQLFAGLIDKLKSIREIDGSSLFDNIMLTYASGVRSAHNNKNLPVIVTGGAGGQLKPTGCIDVADRDARLSNLWLTSLQVAGVPSKKFAHSNGTIDAIRK